jgi:SAM-dependent methyltransferase
VTAIRAVWCNTIVSSPSLSNVKQEQGLLDRQFGHPSGVLGTLVGAAMAIEHRALHKAVVARLSLNQNDRVLEIGFGPGTAIAWASGQAGFVAGIDPSREMVALARGRNRSAIRSGRVEVLRASAAAIPFSSDSFTVAFEVNSFHHWDSPEVGLREVFRVLRSGGRLLMTLRQGHGASLEARAESLVKMLKHTGFKQIRLDEHQFGHGGTFVTARR